MLVSFLNGKKVLDLNLQMIGEECRVLFDGKLEQARWLSCKTAGGLMNIPVANIFRAYDVIVLSSLRGMETEVAEKTHPLGGNVYGTGGEFLGVLADIELSKTFKTKKLLDGQGQPLKGKVHVASEGAVLIKTAALKKEKTEGAVRENQLPPLLSGSFDFLMGRRCDKTIYGIKDEVLIKQNAVITEDVLKKTKTRGKLIELALHSK